MEITMLRNRKAMVRTVQSLLLGQLVSLVLSVMSFTSSFVASLGVNTPLTLSFTAYLAITLVYGSIFLCRRQKLLVPWYWYLFLGFIDAQGNYLYNKAYQYSSITSVTILDCWTIAWVIILTWIFLGTKYSLRQFLGAAVCLLGLGLVLLSDAGVGGGGGTKPLLGDTLVIAGTLFFAISNVGEEFCVKKKDVVEFLSMIGLFGLLVSGCQAAILEKRVVESVNWSPEVILAFAGYAVASLMFYILTPFVLKTSGSTMFNLSLLTSDMWAVVIRIFFYRQQVDWLYYVSFILAVIGLVIYSRVDTDPVCIPSPENGDINTQYQLLHEGTAETKVESPAL
ncbi:hypothetical protein DCAR_0310352 [Daucus carota subsp. sativus]|uniref:Uncharacterized protein n=2 Tax=Daucus carota subsp. sativus TaxID=79200 RepID=A0AAF0WL64_DAUCS|nr:PREDICTED: solute carrier family 35 member F1-like isoform X1 [Daucus carota subsp. sativus]WOG91104.1 hypothetical protein DCAR_0310352 [Daucus carota subsp. sativus]